MITAPPTLAAARTCPSSRLPSGDRSWQATPLAGGVGPSLARAFAERADLYGDLDPCGVAEAVWLVEVGSRAAPPGACDPVSYTHLTLPTIYSV